MKLSITRKDLKLISSLSDDDIVMTIRLFQQLQTMKLAEAQDYYRSNIDYVTHDVQELLDKKFDKAVKAAEAAAERRKQPRKPKPEKSTGPCNKVTTPFTQEYMDFLMKHWPRIHNFFHRFSRNVEETQCEYEKIVGILINRSPKKMFIPGYDDYHICFLNGTRIRPDISHVRQVVERPTTCR